MTARKSDVDDEDAPANLTVGSFAVGFERDPDEPPAPEKPPIGFVHFDKPKKRKGRRKK